MSINSTLPPSLVSRTDIRTNVRAAARLTAPRADSLVQDRAKRATDADSSAAPGPAVLRNVFAPADAVRQTQGTGLLPEMLEHIGIWNTPNAAYVTMSAAFAQTHMAPGNRPAIGRETLYFEPRRVGGQLPTPVNLCQATVSARGASPARAEIRADQTLYLKGCLQAGQRLAPLEFRSDTPFDYWIQAREPDGTIHVKSNVGPTKLLRFELPSAPSRHLDVIVMIQPRTAAQAASDSPRGPTVIEYSRAR
ncbi:hypothetical protein [Pararobbsia silviterrae]|uniref:Uncharacterized protein n=1 Tax=Pararobbsia silviterrae TaxID=1792498 RepID=A0A494XFW2_9BURK|nr:hypothetical protein [Pararobbsia silviterrae]RKP48571.1 hypothetical protein D7S86_21410 [Pararobbsia silviterrae]